MERLRNFTTPSTAPAQNPLLQAAPSPQNNPPAQNSANTPVPHPAQVMRRRSSVELAPNQRELLFQHALEQWVQAGSEREAKDRRRVATEITQLQGTSLCLSGIDLTSLPPLPNLLTHLSLHRCDSLTYLSGLPNSLTSLHVKDTQLIGPPNLPDSLTELTISKDGRITTLCELPNLLTSLNVSCTMMTTLPPLPNSLTNLNVSSTQLTYLPPLPNSLKSLNASYCDLLTSLPPLPNSLTSLDVYRSKLTSLPELPNSLTSLDVGSTRLISLPALPNSLTNLRASYIGLTSLPQLPNSLTSLDVSSTHLTSLPRLPNSLTFLNVSVTTLTSLPFLPEGLVIHYSPQSYEALHPTLAELFVGVDPFNSSAQQTLIHRIRAWQQQNPHLVTDYVPPVHHNTILASANPTPSRWASPIPQIIVAPPRTVTPPLEELADPRFHDINAADLVLAYELQRRLDLRGSVDEVVGESSSTAGPNSSRDRAPCILSVRTDDTFPGIAANDLGDAIAIQHLYDMQANLLLEEDDDCVIEEDSSISAASNRPATPPLPVITDWRFSETEDSAAHFNTFQDRVRETAEYRNPHTREALRSRMDRLVIAMHVSPELRGLCFQIAVDGITCGDGIALLLNDMELARIDDDAAKGRHAIDALFAIGESSFKLHAVNEIAEEKIRALEAAGTNIDPAEVRLAYQMELAERLDLPLAASSMLYRGAAHVTREDIDAAERLVTRHLERNESVEFMANWLPWRNMMERNHPQDYADVRNLKRRERESLAVKPRRMTEQQWMDALAELKLDENRMVYNTTIRLTRDYLEENEEEAQ